MAIIDILHLRMQQDVKHFNPYTRLLQLAGFTDSARRVIEIIYPTNARLVSFKEFIGLNRTVALLDGEFLHTSGGIGMTTWNLKIP